MLFANLLLIEPEAEPPLIDIDGTVFLQFGLFVLMFVVLRTFLFKPFLKLKDARHAGIEGARHEAETMTHSAEKALAEYQTRLDLAKVRANDERAKLRSEAAAKEREILGIARDENQKAL